jgi:tight adherence protein C
VTSAVSGAVLGALAGVGVVVVLERVLVLRRPRLEVRVLPYVRDLPSMSGARSAAAAPSSLAHVVAPLLRATAETLDRVLGGSASVRRRLDRLNSPMSVHEFRVQQAMWGLLALSVTALVALLVAMRTPSRALPLLVLCGIAFVLAALWRDNRLSAQVAARERRILAEFPTVAELLALAVAAGEGPVSALDRVVIRADGELATDLARVLAEVRTGTPVTRALDALAARSGLPVVARFAEALAVALERGTPLADVLHAQAADVREAGRRALIESGARREVAMMVPVVFLVLPVTVLFAFWPGVVGLRLVSP